LSSKNAYFDILVCQTWVKHIFWDLANSDKVSLQISID